MKVLLLETRLNGWKGGWVGKEPKFFLLYITEKEKEGKGNGKEESDKKT